MDNVASYEGLANMLDAVVGNASIGFNGAKIFPFTNDVVPTRDMVAADLTPATFTGSTAQVITFGTKYKNADGNPEVHGGLKNFSTTGDVVETIYGFGIVDGADATALRMAFRLETPKAMAVSGDQCDVVPRLTMSSSGFGASLQVSQ